MIPVTAAREPAAFDATVRQKGLAAIDELVGRAPRVARPGPRRAKVADVEADIPGKHFPPFWRDALDDMLVAYERRCAFLAIYLEYGTGNPSVDHMVPKSRAWDRVYEWANYRLCAASVNSRKSDLQSIIDPFEIGDGWFRLELVAFQVIRGPHVAPAGEGRLDATLELLNADEFRRARQEYVEQYEQRHISFAYLQHRAPFVAAELRRQGCLHAGDR